ncbi:pleckstrin homology domain-containing family G member 4B-like [Xenentodon cancila]
MNLDSVEGSIQNLLSVLYPPFEATAPTLLSQLFQIIDSRYQGDALRCFLDFLIPAKHILDTVQQAACAQYPDGLFRFEGWPLCLRDQVVIHLAPINPLLLQPGDFYLQVAPFCDQLARILVCSLLEEEGVSVGVVEETPVPETSYPCLFRHDCLDEINHGRHGTPLSQCLLATEQGLVRLPWEQVAVPEFVAVPRSAWSSMASAPQPHPPLPPLHPSSPPLPDFPKNCSSRKSTAFSPSNESALKQYPVTVQNLTLTSSSHLSAFSVETRICPAKHGIAVSLCLVDTSTASSSQLVKVKETEKEHKPIGWVSPNTWDSRFNGMNSNTVKETSTLLDTCSSASSSTTECKSQTKCISENTVQEECQYTKVHDMSRSCPAACAPADGEYIDILQASMLFGKDQSLSKEQSDMKMQPRVQTEAQLQKYPVAQLPHHTQSQPYMHCLKSQSHLRSVVPVSLSHMSAETGPSSTHHHSQTHPSASDSLKHPLCAHTIYSSEKPCTPCMRRHQGAKVTKALEQTCRYRDSYQAALQNPVTLKTQRVVGNFLAVVEEDSGFSKCDDRQEPLGTESGDPWCDAPGIWCDPGLQNQSTLPVTEDICKESGEINIFPQRKPGDASAAPCEDHRGMSTLQFVGPPDHTFKRSNVPSTDVPAVRSDGSSHHVNATNPAADEKKSSTKTPSTNGSKHSDDSTIVHGVPISSSGLLAMEMTFKAHDKHKTRSTGMSANFESLPVSPNKQDTILDKRCSSLSTTVVNTSEKCELVIVEGQNVRRKVNSDSCAKIPQLHVVKCKNSTAFGLVSPKINRKKIPVAEQAACASITSGVGHQMEKLSLSDPPPMTETQRMSQRASARPRPDYLPLDSRDPTAHPLYLGVASLTGCRDRAGRAIIELYGDHQGWGSAVTSQDLFQMLLYFHSITRKEIREAGMMLIFDARRRNPQPQLYKALIALQEQRPCAASSLVLLVDKENNLHPERCPGIQTDMVTSMKALFKLVDVSQLSARLDGSPSQSCCDWMDLHQRLFPFVNDLHEASNLLLRAISKLEEPQRTDTVQAVQQCMIDQRTLMRDVLEDSRLVNLQREGGAMLARLRKESDMKYPHCEDLSDAVDSVTSLYNHVEEQAHVLVQRTNMSLEHLEYLLQIRQMEAHFMEIQQWFKVEGEHHLLEAESVEDSGERMEQILDTFTSFLIKANDRRHHAMSLVSEAERLQQSRPYYPETEAFRSLVCTFKSDLEDFLCRAEACGRELQIMVNVCDFCEQATMLASECNNHLNQSQFRISTMQDPASALQNDQTNTNNHNQDSNINAACCQSDIHAALGSDPNERVLTSSDSFILQAFQERFLHFSPERFQEVKAQASSLRGSRGMQVWNVAWLRCQEARQQLQEKLEDVDEFHHQLINSNRWCEGHFVDVVSTEVQTSPPGGQTLVVQSNPGPRHPQWEGIVSGTVDLKKRRPPLGGNSHNSKTMACCELISKPEENSNARTRQESRSTPQSPQRSVRKTEREPRRRQMSRARSERDALSQSHTVGCQWFPWGRALGARSVSQDSCTMKTATAASSSPPEQQARPPSSCSHHGQPSCRILQEAQKFQISRHGSFCSEDSCMSDQGAVGGNNNVNCKHSSLPSGRFEGVFQSPRPQESASSALRLQRVMEELVFTERDYTRSLGYILTHYLPLMDRLDIPQDLRGKRGIIFGNLEKLYDFHSHYFLPELEACEREPAMVAHCFLRHRESFALYALYSKNKPQSDALILHRRHDIFKKKQQELGDMMDLSSYLLRPIQRISKYSLLLQDMLALTRSCRKKAMIQDSMSAPDVCAQSVCGLSASSEMERELAEIQAAADLVRFQMRHGNDLLTMDAIQDCDVNLKEQGQLIRQDEFIVFFRKKKCIRRIFLFEDLILFGKPKRTDVGNDVYVYKQSFKTNDIGMTHNSAVSGLCFEIWFRRRKSEDTYTLKASSMEVKKAWTTDLEKILWDQATHSRELRLQERVFMGMAHKPFMDIQPSDAAICDRAVSCVLPGRIPVACCSHRGLEHPRPHSIGSGSTASTTLSQSSSSSGRGSLPPAGYHGNPPQAVDTNPVVTDNEINNHHLQQHTCCCRYEHRKTHCPLSEYTYL